jgi:hypothetical protein
MVADLMRDDVGLGELTGLATDKAFLEILERKECRDTPFSRFDI